MHFFKHLVKLAAVSAAMLVSASCSSDMTKIYDFKALSNKGAVVARFEPVVAPEQLEDSIKALL